jgi:hypothetical protein
MHRAFLPALIAGLFLSACDEATQPTEMSSTSGEQLSAPTFAAITQHERSRSLLELFISNPCTEPEEDLDLTGETFFQSTTTQLPGGDLRIEGLSRDRVSGTGPLTGLAYRGYGVTHFTINTRAGEPFVQVGVGNLRIAAVGSHSLLLVRFRFHLTVNANGKVTVSRDQGSLECH